MDKDLTAVLGSIRSKRYTLIVENNVVKQAFEGQAKFQDILFKIKVFDFLFKFQNLMELV